MKKKKILSTALALSLGVGMLGAASISPSVKAQDYSSKFTSHGSPVDLGIANDERLIEMLKKNGTIAKNATPAEAEKALNKYLANKAAGASKEKGELHKHEKAANGFKDNHGNNSLVNGNGNKLGQAKKNTVDKLELEGWDGGQRSDNVLVLLIEYPDFKANDISPDETDMYYDEYLKQHYEDMIFGEKGYKGPNGETLVSVKQYYEQQSGGSYTIDGEVAGWYEAKNPAAFYGGNNEYDNDSNARGLVKEALYAVAADENVDLSKYDQEDRYDLDGDGELREPDGLIDHLMVVHSSVGEEAGGGSLGADAIWSHRWSLAGVTTLPETSAQVPYWGGKLAAYDYTIEPADGAAGVFAHEYGHDLGLPDEYDTQYTGAGEAVAYWSIMSAGSWAGKVPGTEPTGFSPWAKEFLQGSMPNSNWLTGTTVQLDDVTNSGNEFLLDEANSKGTNNDAVKVQLPQKENVINQPYSGTYEYHSGSANDLDNSMLTSLDLTNATSAKLNFKAWYDIEVDWDYASVQVKVEGSEDWVTVPGNITTTTNPHDQNPGHGITGKSDGWVDAEFDLSAYAGKNVELKVNYWTDVAAVHAGLYVDDLSISVDGSEVLFDDAEGEAKLTLDGFTKDQGKFFSDHYYLLEWRSHNGVDEGLANIRRGASLMSYDSGLVVWYVDESFDNNWTGLHPGEGFLGVVDADQHTNYWSDKAVASSRYQVHDAAFSLNKSSKMFLDYSDLLGISMTDNFTQRNALFNDGADYSNPGLVDAGRNVPTYGLKFRVVGQSVDGTVGKILIFK